MIEKRKGKVLNLPSPRTGNCGTCHFSKRKQSPYIGVMVEGSYGKCCHPGGTCENPIPRLGIDGAMKKSSLKG